MTDGSDLVVFEQGQDGVYTCQSCGTQLAFEAEIVSKRFHGRWGRAFVFRNVYVIGKVCLVLRHVSAWHGFGADTTLYADWTRARMTNLKTQLSRGRERNQRAYYKKTRRRRNHVCSLQSEPGMEIFRSRVRGSEVQSGSVPAGNQKNSRPVTSRAYFNYVKAPKTY